MIINQANLSTLKQAIVTAWKQGFAWKAPVDLSFLVRDYPSSTASNLYAFLHRAPGFKEIVGEIIFENLRAGKFEILNRLFGRGWGIPLEDIEDDQYGIYSVDAESDAQSWKNLLHKIVVEVLTGNPVCATGKAFFSTTHKYGKNTISNKTTDALTATSFNAAFLAASAWKHADGSLVSPNFTHLVVGEKLRATAHAIVEAKEMSDGNGGSIDNPNYRRCKLEVLPDLAGDADDYWFLVDSTQPVKAIARQVRKEPVPVVDDRLEEVTVSGEVKFAARGRAAAGPALPHLIYGGIL